jgi:hypothetical protein
MSAVDQPAWLGVEAAIAAHRTPPQRLRAALQQMIADGLLKDDVLSRPLDVFDVERLVTLIFGPPGVRTPTQGVAPGRRII